MGKRKVKTCPINSLNKEFTEFLKDIDLGFHNKDLNIEKILFRAKTIKKKYDEKIDALEKQIKKLTEQVNLLTNQLDIKIAENLTYGFESKGEEHENN